MSELPVVESDDIEGEETEREVAGVLLAAGTSSRFGAANKLLAHLDGEPVVRHAARTLLDAGLDTVVVLGHEADAVRAALDGLDLRFVENPDYAEGQSTSLRAGVRAVADAEAAVFLPGDMPFVAPETVRALVGAYSSGAGDALAVSYDGHRGNPVLFAREHFDALREVEGDTGGRPVLLGAESGALVAVDDPGVRTDIDTREDLAEYE